MVYFRMCMRIRQLMPRVHESDSDSLAVSSPALSQENIDSISDPHMLDLDRLSLRNMPRFFTLLFLEVATPRAHTSLVSTKHNFNYEH